MIAGALRQALVQLPDPSFRQVLLRSLLISVGIFVLLAAAIWYGITFIPDGGHGWIDWVVGFASGIGFFVLMFLLFPVVMTAAIGLFLDDIAEAVERRWYPDETPGRALAFWPALWGSLRFLGVVLLVNLVLLPLYAVLLFFPPLLYGLSLLVNGWLVSREYFEQIAWRYLSHDEATRMRLRFRGDLWLCGVVIVLLLTIPLVNFLVPIVATAFMVHVYKRLRARV
jgi:uncharacterized protein involved in cysteine biosynthesis